LIFPFKKGKSILLRLTLIKNEVTQIFLEPWCDALKIPFNASKMGFYSFRDLIQAFSSDFKTFWRGLD